MSPAAIWYLGNQPSIASCVAQGHTAGKCGNWTRDKPKALGLYSWVLPRIVFFLLRKGSLSMCLTFAPQWSVGARCRFLRHVLFPLYCTSCSSALGAHTVMCGLLKGIWSILVHLCYGQLSLCKCILWYLYNKTAFKNPLSLCGTHQSQHLKDENSSRSRSDWVMYWALSKPMAEPTVKTKTVYLLKCTR